MSYRTRVELRDGTEVVVVSDQPLRDHEVGMFRIQTREDVSGALQIGDVLRAELLRDLDLGALA